MRNKKEEASQSYKSRPIKYTMHKPAVLVKSEKEQKRAIEALSKVENLPDEILDLKRVERIARETEAVKKAEKVETHKMNRRTEKEIQQLKDDLYNILDMDHPQTVRGVFYQAVSKGIIEKTETEYKNVVVRLLGEMRKDGHLSYDWLADSTRWMRKPRTYSGLEAAMKDSWEYYRKSLWHDQPVYIEVWMEKEALAGVIYQETALWDVPLMITRGYPSLSFLHTAGEAINSIGKVTYIYYFGDYDPSGLDISRKVEEGLREYASDTVIYFERIAVTPQQIQDWSLPTRPTKKTDTRAKNFKGESVELDAVPAKQLRKLVSECIAQHIDQETIERIELAERAEKETLENIILDNFYREVEN